MFPSLSINPLPWLLFLKSWDTQPFCEVNEIFLYVSKMFRICGFQVTRSVRHAEPKELLIISYHW